LANIGKGVLLGRVGEAGEIAAAIFLCMTNAFMTGVTIDVDGGALLP
jgi:NAD(P)-dependent dehydrogenase (short-subunit alcohol dehydrogenase family)